MKVVLEDYRRHLKSATRKHCCVVCSSDIIVAARARERRSESIQVASWLPPQCRMFSASNLEELNSVRKKLLSSSQSSNGLDDQFDFRRRSVLTDLIACEASVRLKEAAEEVTV